VSEYLEENRRAVIMLIVAVCVALLGGLYLLLSSSGQEEEAAPIPHNDNPSAVQDADPAADESEAVESIYVARGTSANPFGPLAGAQKQEESTSGTSSENSTSKSTTSSTSTKKTTTTPTTSTPPKKSSVGNREPALEPVPRQNDPAPKNDDPQSIVPEPIGGPDKNGEELLVRVMDVQPDVMVARVNGERTTLYLNEPNETGGLTYLAPLGGGCAWVGMPDTEVRFSVCKGKTERL
jgi:hypothetical protein